MLGDWRIRRGVTIAPTKSTIGVNTVPGWSNSSGLDEAYRLQYQARHDGHFAEGHYWDRYRQGLEERGPRR
jgi:hypothetical protein